MPEKKINNQEFPKEGEIWLVKFDKLKEFSKTYRPCLVVSNDTQNQFDKNVVVAGLSMDEMERIRMFEIFIETTPENGLKGPSKICCNYLHTINKKLRLVDRSRNNGKGKKSIKNDAQFRRLKRKNQRKFPLPQ